MTLQASAKGAKLLVLGFKLILMSVIEEGGLKFTQIRLEVKRDRLLGVVPATNS